MRNQSWAILVCALITLITSQSIGASPKPQQQTPDRDAAFEQTIYDHLAKINPDAAPIFQEATRALDAGDLARAKRGFEQVLDLAPGFSDALRRLSQVEIEMRDLEAAQEHARQALAADDSPYNKVALAQALVATEDKSYAAEALVLAKSAVQLLPDDIHAYDTLMWAALAAENLSTTREASAKLIELVPAYPVAHFISGLVAAEDGKWEQAERELLLSRELGMPAEVVRDALDKGVASQARLMRWTRRSALAVVAWLAGLALLFVVGLALSQLTLVAVQRPPQTTEFRISTGERIVRGFYAAVIAVTSAYFYVSMPFLILVVVGGAAGLIYLMLQSEHIPVRLLVIVAVVAFYTAAAIVRSLFTRIKDTEPGRPLNQAEAPELWALTADVAQRVGTRPVDAIYVTPGVEVGVTERGNLRSRLRGYGQRCLILGLGALPNMTQGQLAAILAHEYGHFSNRDTAGGNLAGQVRASMYHMAYRLATRGLAVWYNPAWLFVNGFNRVFLRITLGASRLQEILADRYAALAYGVPNFVDGLTRVVWQSLAFDVQVNAEAEQALAQRRGLHNLYTLPEVQAIGKEQELEKQLNDVMSRPTSPYDSHPAVRERFRLVEPLADRSEAPISQEPAWELLRDPDALQREMTAAVQSNLSRTQTRQAATLAAFELAMVKESVPDMTSYHEVLVKACGSGDKSAQAEALDELAGAYEDRGESQRALGYYRDATEIYVEIGDREGERIARFNAAMLQKALGDLAGAEEQLRRLVVLDEARGGADLDSDRQELAAVQALRKQPGTE